MDFYSTSARILDIILAADADAAAAAAAGVPASASPHPSLKALCSQHAKSSSPPRCFAILAETLKYLPVLDKLLRSVDVLKTEAKVLSKKASPTSRALVLVMMHDLLFSKRGIALPKEHKVRQAVEKYATRLRANLQREKIKRGVTVNEALQVDISPYLDSDIKGKGKGKDKKRTAEEEEEDDPDSLEGKIRWLRVNECKWSVSEAEKWLKQNGWTKRASLEEVVALGHRSYALDEHVPNLLAFPLLAVSLPKFAPYQDARLIAQDKASCFPAYLLLEGAAQARSSSGPITVLDATSAPGNKTSYASATLQRLGSKTGDGSGQVFAFERDDKRFQLLNKMLRKAGCTNTQTVHADFLDIDPSAEPYSAATHILVDPSCSGSGIHDDENDEADADPSTLEARLYALSKFQRHILAHALRFPQAERVVYSTCSVHREEDEDVVFDLLAKDEFSETWDLATRDEALPGWPIRGCVPEGEEEDPQARARAEGLIRCERRMGTHGFFVAVFLRRQPEDMAPTIWGGDVGEEEEQEGAEEEEARDDEHVPAALADASIDLADEAEGPGMAIDRPKNGRIHAVAQNGSDPDVATSMPQLSLLQLAARDRRRRRKLAELVSAEKLRKRHRL